MSSPGKIQPAAMEEGQVAPVKDSQTTKKWMTTGGAGDGDEASEGDRAKAKSARTGSEEPPKKAKLIKAKKEDAE